MPRRRRGQEAKRAERRRLRLARQPSAAVQSGTDEVDRGWLEHQAWEQQRRAAPPLVQPPRPARRRLNIMSVIAAVEADFARWEHERQGRDLD